MRELIDQVQHPVLPLVLGAILHKIVVPDMVGPLRLTSERDDVGGETFLIIPPSWNTPLS